MENQVVLMNIYNSLKPGGYFICIDSLDDNVIYRANRLFHFFRGKRSFSTLQNMPSLRLLKRYEEVFAEMEVRFFGALCWLVPVLKPFLREEAISRFIEKSDELFSVRASAFKFVMICRK